MNADKTEYIYFNQKGDICTRNGGSLKLVDNFTYLRSSISSTENDINMWLMKAWIVINRLSINFPSSSHVTSTIWMHHTDTNHLEKKQDGNYTRMLWAILNKSWKQHSTKQQLYGYLPPISKIIQIRWTRHERHYWRSKDELISDVLLWTSSHGRASVGHKLELIYNTSVWKQNVVKRTCLKQWMIEKNGEGDSNKFVLAVWHSCRDGYFITWFG